MNKNYVPDCKLEWYILGELPEQEQAEIAALEHSDEELRARIEALRSSDNEILEDYPPPRIKERLKQLKQYAHGAVRMRISGGAPQWSASILICAALMLILPMLVIVAPALIDTTEADGAHAKDEIVIDTMETGGVYSEDKDAAFTGDSIQTRILD
jgi:anti-sigma factor RsiW